MKFLILITSLLCGTEVTKSAEILAIIPSPFYSHQATFRPLWRELAKHGHKITLITTDPMESNENITQIDFSGVYELKKDITGSLQHITNPIRLIGAFSRVIDRFLTYELGHPDLVKLYGTKKFDLMFVELLIPFFASLSVKFDCPFIGLNTMDAPPPLHKAVGNAINPVVYPYADLGFVDKLSFFDRLKSISFSLAYFFLVQPYASYMGNWYVKKFVGENIPDVYELETNVSAIFINANPLFFSPRPVTPITINLGGGLHIAEPKLLPKDLQKYLDDSKNGCIYVSFGTTVNSEYLSKEQKDVLVNVFKKMAPMRILWKFDDLNVAKGVPNVEVRNWVPQQDILRHPNVKLFITQGGLQSMEEAIDSAVPMLGMPFYGDQVNNVNKMHQKKFGLGLQPKTMNEVSLKSALEELLNNPIYKKNIDKFSAISKDRPMKGLEKAVWWTEYVLRHGTEHLRSPSADIPLYQYFFLDVIAFFSVSLYGLYLFTKYSFRLTCLSIRYLYGALRGKKEKKD